MTSNIFLFLTICAALTAAAPTEEADANNNGTKKGRYIYGQASFFNPAASYVTTCPFSGCTDLTKQAIFTVNVRGSGGIARPPCYCTPQECTECCPNKLRPAMVLNGQPSTFAEPDELGWSCNRFAKCIPTPPCTPCYPDQPKYDTCICYGPGACVCWVLAGQFLPPWKTPKPPCYCEPQTCQGCPPLGVEPLEDIKSSTVSMANERAVSVSHACDWSLPCIPAPICHACLSITHDHCICYGAGTCACFKNDRKAPCYCAKQACPRCYLEKQYPNLVTTRSYHQGYGIDKEVIATACNSAAPCAPRPNCRPCLNDDLKYETCTYFGPGLSICYVGRSGALGGIFG